MDLKQRCAPDVSHTGRRRHPPLHLGALSRRCRHLRLRRHLGLGQLRPACRSRDGIIAHLPDHRRCFRYRRRLRRGHRPAFSLQDGYQIGKSASHPRALFFGRKGEEAGAGAGAGRATTHAMQAGRGSWGGGYEEKGEGYEY